MSVWTISAQPGTPGAEVAAMLAHACSGNDLRRPGGLPVAAYARSELVDRATAARDVRHADHVERNWVRALFDLRVDDPTLYTVVLDASRLATDRIVDVLLAAAGAI